jgi:hypothetical protein
MLPGRKTRRRGCGDTGVHLVGATPIESCRLVCHQSMPAGLLAPARLNNSSRRRRRRRAERHHSQFWQVWRTGRILYFLLSSCTWFCALKHKWSIPDTQGEGREGGRERASERASESTTRLSNYTDNNMIAATALHCFSVGHATPSWCAHGLVQRQTTTTTNQILSPSWCVVHGQTTITTNSFLLTNTRLPFLFTIAFPNSPPPPPPHRPCFTAAGISGGGCRFSNLLHWYSWNTA